MKKSVCSLLVLACLFAGCSKSEKSPKDKYAPKMNRSFTWQRTYFTTRGAMGDTSYTLPDTIIPVNVITPDSLLFMGTSFNFADGYYWNLGNRVGDDGQRLFYADMEQAIPHSSTTLCYYYHSDSVAIIYYSGGLGGYRTFTYTSKD